VPSVSPFWEIYGLEFDIVNPQREIVKIYPRPEVLSRISKQQMDAIIASHKDAGKHFATEYIQGPSDGRYVVVGRAFYAGAFFNALAGFAKRPMSLKPVSKAVNEEGSIDEEAA
jgi:hypothetical protein